MKPLSRLQGLSDQPMNSRDTIDWIFQSSREGSSVEVGLLRLVFSLSKPSCSNVSKKRPHLTRLPSCIRSSSWTQFQQYVSTKSDLLDGCAITTRASRRKESSLSSALSWRSRSVSSERLRTRMRNCAARWNPYLALAGLRFRHRLFHSFFCQTQHSTIRSFR